MPRSIIVGSGSEIGKNLITNDRLSMILDTNDAWIQERSGVKTRYYVDAGTSTSDLGVASAERAIEMSGIAREEIDLVISATMTPDYFFPGNSGIYQTRLGLRQISARGSSTACSSRTLTSGRVSLRPSCSWAPRSTPASCPSPPRPGT
jgi:3-oxoacyl-[acyl-carrier-protein] synthase-3